MCAHNLLRMPPQIMEANEITAWRTAAASAVATKYLHNGTKILAILGSGVQARSHARVLNHCHHFEQVLIAIQYSMIPS